VIGTSGKVIGVNTMASFIEYSILNNLEPSEAIDDTIFSKVYYQKASEAIDEIIAKIEKFII
jgi:NAD-dependent deacetylase